MSKETKHTPGPWTAKAIPRNYPVVFAGQTAVATTDTFSSKSIRHTSVEEAKRNALLIAAAPDLLAVAQWFYSVHGPICGRGEGGDGCGECLVCSARIAIQRATGGAE